MLFDNGISSELKNNLTSLIDGNKIPQSMIIDGGSEEQREELAKELCCAFFCEDNGQEPCNICPSCLKINANSHPDVIFIQAEDNKKTISIDVIRKMREDVFILPNESDRKVYIIRQADTMQHYAQNALLKVLEEPPKYASFILLCDYHTSLLQTVLSRSIVFNIGATKVSQLEEKKQKIATQTAISMADALAKKDEFELLMLTGAFEKDTQLFKSSIVMLEHIFRDALVIGHGGNSLISCSEEAAKTLSRTIPSDKLINLIDNNREIMFEIDKHANTNLTMTRLCSTLIQAIK